ncbi:MAG: sigma-54-dependent Fis family transcriptional regulator [Planctomycetaceae bacterium]|nr:sigma-54-dependent Fis family transcriptional regulator [Planctomycetaceae bacterium]
MMHLHQPKLAIIDLRGSLPTQVARTWATAQSAATTSFVIVTNPGQISDSDIPVEIHQRVNIHSLQPGEEAIQLLIQHVIAIGENPTEKNRTLSPLHSKVTVPTPETSSPSASAIAESGNRSHAAPAGSKRDSGPTAVPDDEPASGMSDKFRTRTPELRSMLRRLEIAARHNVTILLIGETGAGKTHLARLIHDVSPRAGEPFLHLACGALPGDLIESELFGHVKGAFTSAHADKDGKFLAAGNGTILLDEIDVLSPEQQVKLLRVIEKGEFEPVGSNRTLHVKARIIAASNLQLQPLVEQGLFRPDLYYRLNTLSFHLPPLRKRLPDIEPLARFFVHQHATQLGVEIREIAPEFIECLLHYPWPGNVREMENAIRSAVIYSDHGVMKPSALPQHVVEGMAGPGNDPSVSAFFAVRQGDSLGNRIELTEKDIIEQALLKNNFSRTNTARHLGISRVTLYNKMRKYGIMPER